MRCIPIAFTLVVLGSSAFAEPTTTSIAVNTGLIQPVLLGGANLEVDVRFGPFVAVYSHGWSLDMDGAAIAGDMKRQGVSLHLLYSTGIGFGVGRLGDVCVVARVSSLVWDVGPRRGTTSANLSALGHCERLQ